MRIEFKSSFLKDLKRVQDSDLMARVRDIIERAEQAQNLYEIENIKKLRGGERYYRIRLGDYRIGLVLEGDIVVFVRFLHRSDIYRYFP